MLFSGLKDVLKTFDEHGWKGSFTRGFWEIGNGGYDCWFELKYKGLLAARCVAGEVESNVAWFDDDEKEKLVSKILEVYDHLKVREETPSLDNVIQTCEEMSKNNNGNSVKNEYYKTSDGFFDYYVNRMTGEKKLELDENDVEVPANLDDFCR